MKRRVYGHTKGDRWVHRDEDSGDPVYKPMHVREVHRSGGELVLLMSDELSEGWTLEQLRDCGWTRATKKRRTR